MPLPTSGSISMAQMRNEFGLGNPVSMSQMYGKGGAQNSGTISFSDMRGRSNSIVFNPASGSYDHIGHPSKQITASASVVWTWSRTGSGAVEAPSIASGTSSNSIVVYAPEPAATNAQRATIYTISAAGQTWTITLRTPGLGTGDLN